MIPNLSTRQRLMVTFIEAMLRNPQALTLSPKELALKAGLLTDQILEVEVAPTLVDTQTGERQL